MTEHQRKYADAYLSLAECREAMLDFAVLFEEDENGHDQATVEDLKQELDSLMRSWAKLPGNLIGGDLK